MDSIADSVGEECPICCDAVRSDDSIWVCNGCVSLFHGYCIARWSCQEDASEEGSRWSCPCCRSPHASPPQAQCYCGALRFPDWGRAYDHSCQKPCSRPRKHNCPHACTLLCHAGACPPCTETVSLPCPCAKSSIRHACGTARPPMHLRLCSQVCGRQLACGRHTCAEQCHPGPCEACPLVEELSCYCATSHRRVPCGSGSEGSCGGHTGFWSCGGVCGKQLACGNHTCSLPCHKGECTPCEADVSLSHCPCGGTPLADLLATPRTSCLDPMPVCQGVCRKIRACSHRCEATCHTGACPDCLVPVSRSCQCGAADDVFACSSADQFAIVTDMTSSVAVPAFTCAKLCNDLKSCGRHRCNRRCCPLTGQGAAAHACALPCNKLLPCKKHRCASSCHRGRCRPCLEASFEEAVCACGLSVVEPPIACGTVLPSCPFVCTKEQPCGHTGQHRCHFDAQCPPCSAPVLVDCAGGHGHPLSMPCWKNAEGEAFFCRLACAKPLACGHTCQRSCHAGPCQEEDARTCPATCRKPLAACGHICTTPCHEGACEAACQTLIGAQCACGVRQETVVCGSPLALPCDAQCEARSIKEEFSPFIASFAVCFPLLLRRIEEAFEAALCDREVEESETWDKGATRQAWFSCTLHACIAEHLAFRYGLDTAPIQVKDSGRARLKYCVSEVSTPPAVPASTMASRAIALPVALCRSEVEVDDMQWPEAATDEAFAEESIVAGEDLRRRCCLEVLPGPLLTRKLTGDCVRRVLASFGIPHYLMVQVAEERFAVCCDTEEELAMVRVGITSRHMCVARVADSDEPLVKSNELLASAIHKTPEQEAEEVRVKALEEEREAKREKRRQKKLRRQEERKAAEKAAKNPFSILRELS